MVANNANLHTAAMAAPIAASQNHKTNSPKPEYLNPDMLGSMTPQARQRLIDPLRPRVVIDYSVDGDIDHLTVPRRMLVQFSIFAAKSLSRPGKIDVKAKQAAKSASLLQSGPSKPPVQLPMTAIRMQTSDPSRPAIQLSQTAPPKSAAPVVSTSSYPPQAELLVSPPDSVYPQALGYVYAWMENGCKSDNCQSLQPTVSLHSNVIILQFIETFGVRQCEDRFKSCIKSYVNDHLLDVDEVSLIWEELQRFADITRHLVHNLAWDAFQKQAEWTQYATVRSYINNNSSLAALVDEQYRSIEEVAEEKAERKHRRQQRDGADCSHCGAESAATRVQEAANGLRELDMNDYARARGG